MLFSFHPAERIVPLGRIDMYMGKGAIKKTDSTVFTLKEGGEIGFISKVPIRVWVNDVEIKTEREGLLTKARCLGENLTVKYESAE